ncbi:ribosome biogenesis protein FCF1 [Vairimorpha necatrix]|uniref:Ribosome biogenesis protein FCF1 n=1 Tax=Vairimorpha necatrix TaxID=6039 RepID=A0AAX4JBW6_9MICR
MGKSKKLKKKYLNINSNRSDNSKQRKDRSINLPVFDEKFAFSHSLRPPYSVLLDTNYINDCIRKKKDMKNELWTVLDGNIKMHVTDCVISELEKLGRPYRVALALVRNDDIIRLRCDHKGSYADDCIVNRVSEHRCYVVATSDVGLKQRIKNIQGVPIVSFRGQRSTVERFIPATY